MRSLRSIRLGIPAAMLALTAVASVLALCQATGHQKTVASLENCLRSAPHREAMTTAVCGLLKLLQDDSDRPLSVEERLSLAREHRSRFATAITDVRRAIDDERQRWQELLALGRRRQSMDAGTTSVFKTISETLDQLSNHDALAPSDEADLPRRARTIAAFREHVFKTMDLVAKLDPTSRLIDQLNDARERLRRSYEMAVLAGLLGLLTTGLLHFHLRRALWEPLCGLKRNLMAVAARNYESESGACGIADLAQMQTSLLRIRDRCAAIEIDKDREVEDRTLQKVRGERLAGIGLLATGVAHEINNPLTAIVGAADGLHYRLNDLAAHLPPGEAEIVREYLLMLQSEAKRCREITSKLLDFARGRDGERAMYDVTAIVHEVVGMFKHVAKYRSRTIEINRHDPCRAFCNGPEIKQVVLNLVANALQATGENGRLDISITCRPDDVEIKFTDTGIGMTPDTLDHVFDPFFSTKEPGQGTGLGMSISHAIVEKHHGTLEALSAGLGKGSTFRLRLPASEEAATRKEERQAA
ncbi:MAG: ATP-binding protein [Planctomyces sp.]|nr:ATP-binding protein [Planctomyces sp.]